MKVAEARPSSNCESELLAALAASREIHSASMSTRHIKSSKVGAPGLPPLSPTTLIAQNRTNPDIEFAFDAFKDNNVSRATVAEMPSIAETARQELNGWGR